MKRHLPYSGILFVSSPLSLSFSLPLFPLRCSILHFNSLPLNKHLTSHTILHPSPTHHRPLHPHSSFSPSFSLHLSNISPRLSPIPSNLSLLFSFLPLTLSLFFFSSFIHAHIINTLTPLPIQLKQSNRLKKRNKNEKYVITGKVLETERHRKEIANKPLDEDKQTPITVDCDR